MAELVHMILQAAALTQDVFVWSALVGCGSCAPLGLIAQLPKWNRVWNVEW